MLVVIETRTMGAEKASDIIMAMRTIEALEGMSANALNLRERTTPRRKASRIASIISMCPWTSLSRKTLIQVYGSVGAGEQGPRCA
jgi:hypothetical protein